MAKRQMNIKICPSCGSRAIKAVAVRLVADEQDWLDRGNGGGLWPICHKDPFQTAVNVNPSASNRRKSEGLTVASAASARSAMAAIMQSRREPRRRPDVLNRRAATGASSSVKATCSETSCAASSPCGSSTGPQRNSAQAIALMLKNSPLRIHSQSPRSSAEPGTRARIRKLVSRWTTT